VLKKKPFLLLFLIIFSLFFCSVGIDAKKALIKDVMITNDVSHLLLYARVSGCFTEKIDRAVYAGVPTTFTILVDVFREDDGQPDKRLSRIKVQHTIKYDNIKKIFNVSVDGQKSWVSFTNYNHAKQMMADINALPVMVLNKLDKNHFYYLKLKVELRKVKLPLHLEYLLFFVSFWDIETDWHVERFFY